MIPTNCPVYLWWKQVAELAGKEQLPNIEDYCLRRMKQAEMNALNKSMLEQA